MDHTPLCTQTPIRFHSSPFCGDGFHTSHLSLIRVVVHSRTLRGVRSAVVTGYQPVVCTKGEEETEGPHDPKHPPSQGCSSHPHACSLLLSESAVKPASELLSRRKQAVGRSLACWPLWGKDAGMGSDRGGGAGVILGGRKLVLFKLPVGVQRVCKRNDCLWACVHENLWQMSISVCWGSILEGTAVKQWTTLKPLQVKQSINDFIVLVKHSKSNNLSFDCISTAASRSPG